MERFAREVLLPEGSRIPLGFVTARMTDGGAFRGSAGECIDAVFGISLLMDYVLPQPRKFAELFDDVHCFRLLVRIIDRWAADRR